MELLNLRKSEIIQEIVNFRVSKNFLNRLNENILKSGLSKSEFIRRALEKELI